MKLSELISNIKMKYPFQEKRRRNRKALNCLNGLGFSLPEIRRALLYLNGITINGIANGEVSQPTITNTVKGIRVNPAVQQKIADQLSLQVEEVFPN